MTTDTHDGPGLALSDLYEASDLLKVLSTYNEETGHATTTREWSGRLAAQNTMTGEISRRLNAAIAHLDGAVQHPAEEQAEGSEDYTRLMELQIHLEELIGTSRLASEQQDNDFAMTLRTIERGMEAVRDGMEALIPAVRRA